MNATLRVEGDKIVKTTVEEFDRYVDWDDIKGDIEGDDWTGEAPWEHSDGWEHEVEKTSHWDHEDRTESYTYYNTGGWYDPKGFIIVDDDDVIKWGCVGPTGCSKQVRFEAIARAKRKATEQLVKWYENGWYVYCAFAKYGDYDSSLGGIYGDSWADYVKECVEDCRHEVADQLEQDDYIVEGRPEVKQYSQVDAFKDRIRRNLNQWIV